MKCTNSINGDYNLNPAKDSPQPHRANQMGIRLFKLIDTCDRGVKCVAGEGVRTYFGNIKFNAIIIVTVDLHNNYILIFSSFLVHDDDDGG